MSEKRKKWSVPGIPDEMFVRGGLPMTKEEVRTLTVAKMRLSSDSVVLDIGAGTGSISVECALLSPGGRVYAVERNPAGVELIKQNTARFGVQNCTVIGGEAPECLEGLPPVDAVLVGGSGGKLPEIIKKSAELLKQGGRLVINAILLETLAVSLRALREAGLGPVELMSVSIAKGAELGGGTVLKPLNPVFILWAEKDGGVRE